MKTVPISTIQTVRLVLRKIHFSDLQNYHSRLTSDAAVAKHMLWNSNSDIAHTQATIERILEGYNAGTRYHWAIALKEDDSLIGTIALLGFDEGENSCSFAYMLGKDFWGKGYGTEALRAALTFAFQELDISLVTADHFEENTASGAVMEKAGMVQEGLLPCRYEKNGESINAVKYILKKEDFFKNNP